MNLDVTTQELRLLLDQQDTTGFTKLFEEHAWRCCTEHYLLYLTHARTLGPSALFAAHDRAALACGYNFKDGHLIWVRILKDLRELNLTCTPDAPVPWAEVLPIAGSIVSTKSADPLRSKECSYESSQRRVAEVALQYGISPEGVEAVLRTLDAAARVAVDNSGVKTKKWFEESLRLYKIRQDTRQNANRIPRPAASSPFETRKLWFQMQFQVVMDEITEIRNGTGQNRLGNGQLSPNWASQELTRKQWWARCVTAEVLARCPHHPMLWILAADLWLKPVSHPDFGPGNTDTEPLEQDLHSEEQATRILHAACTTLTPETGRPMVVATLATVRALSDHPPALLALLNDLEAEAAKASPRSVADAHYCQLASIASTLIAKLHRMDNDALDQLTERWHPLALAQRVCARSHASAALFRTLCAQILHTTDNDENVRLVSEIGDMFLQSLQGAEGECGRVTATLQEYLMAKGSLRVFRTINTDISKLESSRHTRCSRLVPEQRVALSLLVAGVDPQNTPLNAYTGNKYTTYATSKVAPNSLLDARLALLAPADAPLLGPALHSILQPVSAVNDRLSYNPLRIQPLSGLARADPLGAYTACTLAPPKPDNYSAAKDPLDDGVDAAAGAGAAGAGVGAGVVPRTMAPVPQVEMPFSLTSLLGRMPPVAHVVLPTDFCNFVEKFALPIESPVLSPASTAFTGAAKPAAGAARAAPSFSIMGRKKGF